MADGMRDMVQCINEDRLSKKLKVLIMNPKVDIKIRQWVTANKPTNELKAYLWWLFLCDDLART